jgi:uncharacterized protein (UPF0218 family)
VIQIRLLTDDLRVKLKSPLGKLLKGSFAETMNEFEKIIKTKKLPMIISVGDALSEALLKHGIFPKVLIIDNKVMRKPSAPFVVEGYETVNLNNDSGTISDDAWAVVESAVKRESNVKIIVEGEEDMLSLVAILSAPENAFVVYGQPHEGMVVVEVTAAKKNEMRKIVDAMEHAVSKS